MFMRFLLKIKIRQRCRNQKQEICIRRWTLDLTNGEEEADKISDAEGFTTRGFDLDLL